MYNKKIITVKYNFIFTQLSQLSYFVHFTLNTFWSSEFVYPWLYITLTHPHFFNKDKTKLTDGNTLCFVIVVNCCL